MIYHYPIKFDFIEDLISYSKKLILDYKKIIIDDVKDILFIRFIPRKELLDQINHELLQKGYPTVYYCVNYIRGANNKQDVHVDGATDNHPVIHAALNIPISGTSGSTHTWLTGDFNLQSDAVYFKPIWNEPPKIGDTLELLESCFVRVDQPHFACGNGKEPRWIVTVRFNDNPTLEELIEISKRHYK